MNPDMRKENKTGLNIQTCMELVNRLAPGRADDALKLRLLGEIEGRVKVELLGYSPEETDTFDSETPGDTELCAPHPYDQLYWLYVLTMMDYLSGDPGRYENGATMFNAAYQGYGKWLKRQGV